LGCSSPCPRFGKSGGPRTRLIWTPPHTHTPPGERTQTFLAGQHLLSHLLSQPPSWGPPLFRPSLGLIPLGQFFPDPAFSLPISTGSVPSGAPWPHSAVFDLPLAFLPLPQPPPLWVNPNYKSTHSAHSLTLSPFCSSQ
jgi:hypothetical protein